MPQRRNGAQLDLLAIGAIRTCLGMPESLRETAVKASQSLLCQVQDRVLEVHACLRNASQACEAWYVSTIYTDFRIPYEAYNL